MIGDNDTKRDVKLFYYQCHCQNLCPYIDTKKVNIKFPNEHLWVVNFFLKSNIHFYALLRLNKS